MTRKARLACVASLAATVGIAATNASAAEPDWMTQFGSTTNDDARAVATGPDNAVHVVGRTAGALAGSNKGDDDAFIVTFDDDGNVVWQRQPGTAYHTGADGVATDADGNVYMAGSLDAFLVKFDPNGRILWRRQPPRTTPADARAVATDADGNVYVAGSTMSSFAGPNQGDLDAFLVKYDPAGRVLWRTQFGTSGSDDATGVATDADGNVYIVGLTDKALGGTFKGITDAFVIKFDRYGHIKWKRQPGTPVRDWAAGVATDAGSNVYITGLTMGQLAGAGSKHGGADAFLIKLSAQGRFLWKRQPGTDQDDIAHGVATDADGNVVIAGITYGSLAAPSTGQDAFTIKFDAAGSELWADQPNLRGSANAQGIATDSDGNIYVAGTIRSDPDNPHASGGTDVFLIKYLPTGPQ